METKDILLQGSSKRLRGYKLGQTCSLFSSSYNVILIPVIYRDSVGWLLYLARLWTSHWKISIDLKSRKYVT